MIVRENNDIELKEFNSANMKLSKTREQLIKMYIKSLKEDIIPWKQTWIGALCINGISHVRYKGVNRALLSYITNKEKYDDPRWFTYLQIKNKGYKLKSEAKGKGVPIEFWSCYNIQTKKKVELEEYQKIVELNPEEKKNYRIICKTSYVFNGRFVEGLEGKEGIRKISNIETSKKISKLIKKLGVGYLEQGDSAYYNIEKDEIVLPEKHKFIDKYSYYATKLHEMCHATGHKSRLNRNMDINSNEDRAREELIAEISSSFLMSTLNVNPKAEHYDNHKSYIQSWISILENKPNELFKAINESDNICNYMKEIFMQREKEKEMER